MISTYFCKGIVPAIILIIFFGGLALYTSILLINFKLNHPEVHNMGTKRAFFVYWLS